MSRDARGTIFLEEARVLSQLAYDGEQFVLRLAAPRCAAQAAPGSFAHVSCDASIPMRRPLSIMRASAQGGWIELLYKVVGPGLQALAAHKAGDRLSVLGPIGQPFRVHRERPRPLLLGGGVGIPPMVFLAERLKEDPAYRALVLMGSEIPFPFRARPSTLIVPGMPAGTIATMPLLEEWNVACRLASRSDFPGCFPGFVTELAAAWLATLPRESLDEVEIFACGPTAMLAACAQLARRFGLPCQVSLEEFMACAVGGCAGCAVEVRTPAGRAMKRVCVDGPVFDAYSVF
ncbi:MAG: dihydroorotate dehydrogenase electron transfer subunit [Gammaproteobacteria bacterium]|nr:dihydroorotate dehydrogenase electron transfer subunit [Gammaproteobacteria bacterium]MBV9698457.1 dihydroorotate dehydrogenase electron transfer subunit [Gammaproteobacteria bacterium]